MTTYPPDDRLDGPVHTWFGLSYSNYLVLHRTLMQSMPVEWQERMVACLDELYEAYAHVDKPDTYWVQPAQESAYAELSDAEMKRLGVERSDIDSDVYFDALGDEHGPYDRILVPRGDDPVPHYNRGRTYIEPRLEEATTS